MSFCARFTVTTAIISPKVTCYEQWSAAIYCLLQAVLLAARPLLTPALMICLKSLFYGKLVMLYSFITSLHRDR